jgi:PAS domain S-box-containing protein
MLGYSPEEYAENPDIWRQLLHPEDADHVLACLRRAHETGEPFSGEYRMRRRDGRWIWVRDDAVMVHGEDGRPVMLQGVMTDISARKDAEEDLRASEERFRLLFARSPMGIVIADRNMRVESASPAFCRMLGYEADELKGRSLAELTHPEDREPSERAVALAMEDRRSDIRMEKRYLAKDGRTVWAEVTGAGFTLGNSADPHAFILAAEVTERKQREEAILAYQQKLRALNRELSRAEEGERRRIAEVLHDGVGQLLMATGMHLAAVQAGQLEERDREYLRRACELLDEAGDVAHRLIFELSPPVLRELGLVPALDWLAERLGELHGLQVTVTAPDGLPRLPGETATFVFRCVRELLANVVKHSGVNEAHVAVQAMDHVMVLTITDDGAGFDPAEVLSSRALSPGFGLFSVRERLGDLGGSLEISSTPGLGTRITMTVPTL